MQTGEVLEGRFQITELLGEGGMGQVWLAIDLNHSQPNSDQAKIVIKELKADTISNTYVTSKFNSEIAALKKIKHPGVVGFVAQGNHSTGVPYLVIEYIIGKNLRSQIIPGGITDLSRIANIIEQLGEAINAAHQEGIYHRDLKPENIMISWPNNHEMVKVIDFGIATVKEKKDQVTKTTEFIGTIDYMAPEQILGKPSSSSDIYAMAVIVYEMLTGIRPFNPKPHNAAILIQLQQLGNIIRPKALRPDLPEKADSLIIQALSYESQNRPNSASEFGQKLAQALQFTNTSNKINSKNIILITTVILIILILGITIKFSYSNSNTALHVVNSNQITSNKKLFINYSINLSELISKNKYKPAIQLAGQEIIFHDGDRIKFNFEVEVSGYFYLINESPRSKNNSHVYTILYPSTEENNKAKENQQFSIPNEIKDLGIEFFGQKGTEKIWIIFSSQKIPLIDNLSNLINERDLGVIKSHDQIFEIQKLLSNPISNATLDSDKKQMSFPVNNTGITVALLNLHHY